MKTALLGALLALGIGCGPAQTPAPEPAWSQPEVAPAAADCPAVPASADSTSAKPADTGPLVLQGTKPIPEGLRKRLNQYLQTRSASLGDIDARAKRALITTRFGDTGQVHLVEGPGAARRQLTFAKEPIRSPRFVPGQNAIIFSSDSGGNEQHQFYRLNLKTGIRNQLTKSGSRNQDMVWAPSGTEFAFMSNRRNLKDFDVWMVDAKTGEGKVLVEGKGYYYPIDFSKLGRKLLVGEYISRNISRLYIADVASGKVTKLSNDDTAAFPSAKFGANDNEVYVATDRGREFVELYRVNLKKGTWQALTRDIPWDIGSLTTSGDGRTLAFTSNDNGMSALYVVARGQKKPRRVKAAPAGIITGLRFAKKAQVLGFAVRGPTLVGDVFSYDLRRKKLARWTESEVGGLDTKQFVSPEVISVKSFDGRMVPAYLYKPARPGPFPVVINIHGGPESQSRPYFSSFTQFMVRESKVAVIYPNVRGSAGYGKSYLLLDNGFKREDSVKDIGAILDWIGTNKDLDAKRVAVLGGSYGGYMVLASLVRFGERLKAGIDVVGISNFVTFLENTADYRRDLRRAEYGDERDPKMRAHLQRISPLAHVDKIKSALFVAQGANDPRVPASEAEQIVKAVRKAGHDVWYMLAKNEGHGFRKKENRDTYLLLSVMFLLEHLK